MLKFFSHLSKINLQSNLIGLIFILFIMLIPIIGFLSPKQERSLTENRNLTIKINFKTLTLKNFSQNINSYLNDTFGLRNYFIQFNKTIKYIFKVIISHPDLTIIYGKDNFLFLQKYSFFYYLSKEQISNKVNVVTNNLKKARDAYPSSIPIFFISIPTKEYLYKDKLPKFIKSNSNREILINKLQNSLSNIKGLYFLDLEEVLLNEKKNNKTDYLFYKNDTHWTSWSAYINYKEIIKFINHKLNYNIKLPSNKVLKIINTPFYNKNTSCINTLNDLCIKQLNLRYKELEIINKNIISSNFNCKNDNNIDCLSNYSINLNGNKKILIFGDSFTYYDNIGIKKFFTYNFKDVYFIHNQWTTANKDIYKKTIAEIKPDIILIIIAIPINENL